jgi:hypothetical protein
MFSSGCGTSDIPYPSLIPSVNKAHTCDSICISGNVGKEKQIRLMIGLDLVEMLI